MKPIKNQGYSCIRDNFCNNPYFTILWKCLIGGANFLIRIYRIKVDDKIIIYYMEWMTICS